MENMERFTPLYAIVNSTENLRFVKEDYLRLLTLRLFNTGYFIKEMKIFFPVFPYVVETFVEVWENSKKLRAHVPTSISRSPKLPLVFL